MSEPVRVLIVDDSAVVRRVLCDALSRQPGIVVVGEAPDPYIAREKIVELEPDVITLDINMPRMDGLTVLKKLSTHHPIPTIILSAATDHGADLAIECLEAGAVEVLGKPSGAAQLADLSARLGDIIRGIKSVRVGSARAVAARAASVPPAVDRASGPTAPAGPRSDRLVAIGSSTGGTEALREVLTRVRRDAPGIVCVQHMPAGFTAAFARRLNDLCEIEVREAADGDEISQGLALIAPGDRQLKLVRDAGGFSVNVFDGPRVCRHRPSVEVLFESAAGCARSQALGVILTGMGADGARGLLSMRKAGAHTIAQDKDTCVVYGMPREAVECGAACEILPLGRIAGRIAEFGVGCLRASA